MFRILQEIRAFFKAIGYFLSGQDWESSYDLAKFIYITGWVRKKKGNRNMELKDLIGKHILDAVDFSNEKIKCNNYYEDSQVMRFRLDGEVYTVIENPEDGYRSTMREIKVSNDFISNNFTPIEVKGIHKIKNEYNEESDILTLIDAKTGKIIIEVGTDNLYDYYPCFIAYFNPKNMIINQ